MIANDCSYRKPSRGHTLIELMVAIIIGMILVIAAFSVLANFEGYKRTTAAMNDALQSGQFGLFELDKLVRAAGSGISQYGNVAGFGGPLNYTSADGVTVNGGAVASMPVPFSTVTATTGLRLAPAIVYPSVTTSEGTIGGAPAKSDVIVLMLGGAGFGEAPLQIQVSSQVPTLTNTVGFVGGQWVLAGPAGIGPNLITTVAAGFNYAPAPTPYLPLTTVASGGAAAAAGGYVVGLGSPQAANFMMYGIGVAGGSTANALYSLDLLNSLGTAQKVSDDIVFMRAIYCVQPTAGSTATWTNPVANVAVTGAPASPYNFSPTGLLTGTTTASTAIQSIHAIRIALIVRAPLNEKNASNLNAGSYKLFSSLTTQFPAVAVTWTVPVGANTNYRYREIEATIPIRNGGNNSFSML